MSYAVSRRSLFGGISILSLGALPLTARAQTPATAPGAPPAVEVFAAPAFVDQVALSPDGKTVALVTQRGDDMFRRPAVACPDLLRSRRSPCRRLPDYAREISQQPNNGSVRDGLR